MSNEDVARTLTQADFESIASILYQVAGIRLTEGKRELVRARLRKRILATGQQDFAHYVRLVQDDPARELGNMVEALTTNETHFFREPAHFDFLAKQVLQPAKGPVRIWSAACSTGEEPYSIAMSVLDEPPASGARSVRVLATDIDGQVLATARRGVYAEECLERGISAAVCKRHFTRVEPSGKDRGGYRVADPPRSLVTFARLNLMGNWPMRGPFDTIFLRNVMIYFDGGTRAWLALRMAKLLAPGGFLLIGHSESLGLAAPGLRNLQPSVYQRTDEALPDAAVRPP